MSEIKRINREIIPPPGRYGELENKLDYQASMKYLYTLLNDQQRRVNLRSRREQPDATTGMYRQSYGRNGVPFETRDERGEIIPTDGALNLAMGLLSHGNVQQFPGGIGLNYDCVMKYGFLPQYTNMALNELVGHVWYGADIIMTVDSSGLLVAGALMGMGNKPTVRVTKGNGGEGFESVQVPSYTKPTHDNISLSLSALSSVLTDIRQKTVSIVGVDDIVDVGTIAEAMDELTHIASLILGRQIVFEEIAAPIVKGYTGARERLRQNRNISVAGVLQIEDLGLDPSPWMRIAGIPNTALHFKQ